MSRVLIDFYSEKLHCNTNCYVILPNTNKDFLANGVRYNKDGKIKVLWLLHGMGDDYTGYLRFTNLERYALARGIAVILPSVSTQCFYADMIKGPAYFSYITEDLPKFIHETFPQLSTDREDNYIAGLSMGGYGALKAGLVYPEKYCKIGCMSSGNIIELELPPESDVEDFMTPFYGVARNAFGKDDLSEVVGTKDDVKVLFDDCVKAKRSIPDIYMYIGQDDFLRAISDSTYEHYRSKNDNSFELKYDVKPGVHDWNFWEATLPQMMDDMGLTSLL